MKTGSVAPREEDRADLEVALKDGVSKRIEGGNKRRT
jgi:hypothetical protein